MSSCSPRVRGSMPASRSAASARSAPPAQPASAARRVLRRCANAASMQANTASREAGVRGGSRRTSETRPESTLGTGQKTLRLTVPARRTSAYHAALRLGTPYVLLPGPAARRSATSSCTITRTRCSEGNASRKLRTTGTEMLYGRFATRAVGWGSGRLRTVRASAPTTVSRSRYAGATAATVSGSAAASVGSTSTATTVPTSGSRASVSDPRPGPTSTTVSAGPTPARRTILRTVLASTTKFWPHCLVGRTPSRPAISRTCPAPSRPVPDGWACNASSFMPSSLGGSSTAPEPQRVRGPHGKDVARRSGRVRAAPLAEAGAGAEHLGDGDLLLAGGEVGARGVLQAAGGRPRRLGELQAAVVAVAGVGVPVAAGLALGDPVPHARADRGCRGAAAGRAAAGGTVAGGAAARGALLSRLRLRRGLGLRTGLGALGGDAGDRLHGDGGAGGLAALLLAVDPGLEVADHALALVAGADRAGLAPVQVGVLGRAAGERDGLGDLDGLLRDPGDGDRCAGLADGGGQGRVDPVLRADADLHLGQHGLDGRGGAAGLARRAVHLDRDRLGGRDGDPEAPTAEGLRPRDRQLGRVGTDAHLGQGRGHRRRGGPVALLRAVHGDREQPAVAHDDLGAVGDRRGRRGHDHVVRAEGDAALGEDVTDGAAEDADGRGRAVHRQRDGLVPVRRAKGAGDDRGEDGALGEAAQGA